MNMYNNIMNGLDAWLGIKKLHNPFLVFELSSNNIHNLLFLNTPLFNSIHDIPFKHPVSHLPFELHVDPEYVAIVVRNLIITYYYTCY